MLGRRAGSTVSNMRVYNAESPKQGSRRLNSIVETKYIDDLGIVYLCSDYSNKSMSRAEQSVIARAQLTADGESSSFTFTFNTEVVFLYKLKFSSKHETRQKQRIT